VLKTWKLVPGIGQLFALCATICLPHYALAQTGIVSLNTGGGQLLVSESRGLSVDSNQVLPALEFEFGFATDESFQAGSFFDSFTVTLQDQSGSPTAVYWTIDASGLVAAPPTAGALNLNVSGVRTYTRAYPNLSPALSQRQAFQARALIPPEFAGRPVTIFFDLFDNQDDQKSQAWFTEPRIVGAPLLSLSTLTGDQLAISRLSPSFGFELEQSATLAADSWVSVTQPVQDDGTNKVVVVNASTGTLLFRLKQQ